MVPVRPLNLFLTNKAVFVSIIVFLISFTPAMAEDAPAIDDETCLDCHEQFDRTLRATPHRLSSEINNPAVVVACVGCHEGAEMHLEDPDRGTIGNPALLSGSDVRDICFDCHTAHIELDNYGFDTHTVDEINCGECHQIHGSNHKSLRDNRADFCRICHEEKTSGLMAVSNHPVNQGNLTCLSCHRFVKRLNDNLAYDQAGICRDCHPTQAGPFMYEHEAINAYAVEGGGCVVCHAPHGSANNRLLHQPDRQLCLQCHLPAGHQTAHGGIWSEYDCQVCHIETHGSFVSNLYLDENLPTKLGGDCYNTGCHSLNR
ncbi:MAG: hypothetical protein GY841_20900 [FCB group bacterium]|nr:hypothetical protein [FCB group bacterium]